MILGILCVALPNIMKDSFGNFLQEGKKVSSLLFFTVWLGPLLGIVIDHFLSKNPVREWVLFMVFIISIFSLPLVWLITSLSYFENSWLVTSLSYFENSVTQEVQITIGIGVSCFMNGVCLFIETVYQYRQLKKLKLNHNA